MMCSLRYFCLTLFLGTFFSFSAPMESLTQYNVILVHGAADSLSGMNCSAADLKDAYSYWDNTADTLKKIEGYLKISWDPKLKDLDHKDTSRSTATGMIKMGWMAERIVLLKILQTHPL